MGGDGAWDNVDQTDAQCPNDACADGSRAYFYMVQIRSADEPMTIFYKVGFDTRWRLVDGGDGVRERMRLTDVESVCRLRPQVEGELMSRPVCDTMSLFHPPSIALTTIDILDPAEEVPRERGRGRGRGRRWRYRAYRTWCFKLVHGVLCSTCICRPAQCIGFCLSSCWPALSRVTRRRRVCSPTTLISTGTWYLKLHTIIDIHIQPRPVATLPRFNRSCSHLHLPSAAIDSHLMPFSTQNNSQYGRKR